MPIHTLSANAVIARLGNGELTAAQVFSHQQKRIKHLDSQYHAFIHSLETPENTNPNNLLKGLPISVKDQIHVAGAPCTSGYEALRNFIPDNDAPVVAALKAAGANILGKTNLPPLAMDFQTSSQVGGTTRNPWNTDYTVGGSSGGGAAALAAGLTFMEIGADLAGSLRIPAAFCGVCSLMPSVNRIPVKGTMTQLEQAGLTLEYLPRVGPMAREVKDLNLFWQALTGEQPITTTAARLAMLPPTPNLPLHPRISEQMEGFMHTLRDCPSVQLDVTAPQAFDWHNAWQAYGIIQGHQLGAMMSPFQRFLSRLLSRKAMKRSPNFIAPIQNGYRRNKRHYEHALSVREQLTAHLDVFLERYDAWVLPVTLVPAFKHIKPSFERGFLRDYDHTFEFNGERLNYFEALTRLTMPFNLTGHPVVTLPIGIDENSGVPMGVQLVGKRDKEQALLATAALLENLFPPLGTAP